MTFLRVKTYSLENLEDFKWPKFSLIPSILYYQSKAIDYKHKDIYQTKKSYTTYNHQNYLTVPNFLKPWFKSQLLRNHTLNHNFFFFFFLLQNWYPETIQIKLNPTKLKPKNTIQNRKMKTNHRTFRLIDEESWGEKDKQKQNKMCSKKKTTKQIGFPLASISIIISKNRKQN